MRVSGKPHISRRPWSWHWTRWTWKWQCNGNGGFGLGDTPAEAYTEWLRWQLFPYG